VRFHGVVGVFDEVVFPNGNARVPYFEFWREVQLLHGQSAFFFDGLRAELLFSIGTQYFQRLSRLLFRADLFNAHILP